jgi:hypothetical protein
MSSKEDKFERLWKHADEMFAKVDKMFANFPWSEPLNNDGFFHRTVTYTNPVPFVGEDDYRNPVTEYKLVKLPVGSSFADKEAIEEFLNGYGEDGWDLNCFEFGHAIFSRFVEDEDETEESGPEDV